MASFPPAGPLPIQSPAYPQWFETIAALVMAHSPSGAEGAIDRLLIDRFEALGADWEQDAAGNLVAKLPGRENAPTGPGGKKRAIAITAHKDEIGMIVQRIEPDGRVRLGKLSGTFPWIYGEGPVDLLGDRQTVTGILSFGSRHVPEDSPLRDLQKGKPLTWPDTWLETGRSAASLAAAGVRPGTRVVVGHHRKAPLRLGEAGEWIASYTLDNKAALAIMLNLLERAAQGDLCPQWDTYLVASAKEEVGAIGAMYLTNRMKLDALVALEIAPIAPEYPIVAGPSPVLLSQDAYGIYDEDLNQALATAGQQVNVAVQRAAIGGFGSDGSIVMKFGHVPRAACLGFPTQNTHGYEIAHLGSILACADLLAVWLKEGSLP